MSEREPSNAELLVHIAYIREAADKTNGHLSKLNGRVGDAEQAIAVLQDRGSEAKLAGKTAGAKYGGIVGGLITGAAMVYQFFRGGQ